MIRQSFPWTKQLEENFLYTAEYVSYAKDCLGNQTLKFNIQDYDDYDEMLQALQNQVEIDMIFILEKS